MAIMAARLKPVDKRRNFLMRTYVSANSRTRYEGGTEFSPSQFRIVEDPSEIRELQEFQQFEILEFDDKDHLREYIQQEMEQRARLGLPAVRAQVVSGTGIGHEVQASAPPRKTVMDRLPPQATQDAQTAASGVSSASRTNTGRPPVAEATTPAASARQPAAGSPREKAKNKKRSVRPASDD